MAKEKKEKPKLPIYAWAATAGAVNNQNSRIAYALNSEADGQLAQLAARQFYSSINDEFGNPLSQERTIAELLSDASRNATPGYIGNPALQKAMKGYAGNFKEIRDETTAKEAVEYALSRGYIVPDELTEKIQALIKEYGDKKLSELDSNNKEQKQLLDIAVLMSNEIVNTENPMGLYRGYRLSKLVKIVNEEN